jgi:hypothetical protein
MYVMYEKFSSHLTENTMRSITKTRRWMLFFIVRITLDTWFHLVSKRRVLRYQPGSAYTNLQASNALAFVAGQTWLKSFSFSITFGHAVLMPGSKRQAVMESQCSMMRPRASLQPSTLILPPRQTAVCNLFSRQTPNVDSCWLIS